jgi:hypothetical protein
MINKALENFYAYNNSVNGILETLSTNKNNLEQLKELVDTTDLSFLKEVMSQLG